MEEQTKDINKNTDAGFDNQRKFHLDVMSGKVPLQGTLGLDDELSANLTIVRQIQTRNSVIRQEKAENEMQKREKVSEQLTLHAISNNSTDIQASIAALQLELKHAKKAETEQKKQAKKEKAKQDKADLAAAVEETPGGSSGSGAKPALPKAAPKAKAKAKGKAKASMSMIKAVETVEGDTELVGDFCVTHPRGAWVWEMPTVNSVDLGKLKIGDVVSIDRWVVKDETKFMHVPGKGWVLWNSFEKVAQTAAAAAIES